MLVNLKYVLDLAEKGNFAISIYRYFSIIAEKTQDCT